MRSGRFVANVFHSIGLLILLLLILNYTTDSKDKTEMTTFTKDEISRYKNGWTDEEDERFLNYIRLSWLVTPSHGLFNGESLTIVDFSQYGQAIFVDEVRIPLLIRQYYPE